MSLKKRAARRLSLLAGSSLVAASLATLAPGMALAANECAPIGVAPDANGTTADAYACTGATTYQTSGITYTTEGNLTVTATGAMNVGAVGINLVGEGADNVTFTINNALTGTGGAAVDVTTQSGNISVTTFGIIATTAGMTNAVRLESTGGGDITFTKNQTPGNFPAANTAINNNVAGADAAVSAITNGGDIAITIATGTPTTNGMSRGLHGRVRGVVAQTSGSGAVVVNVTGQSGITVDPANGVVALDVVAGTGGADINLSGTVGGQQNFTGRDSPFTDALAMRIVSSGAVTIDNTTGKVVGAVDFSGVTAGGVRFENVGIGNAVGSESVYPSGGKWHAAGHSIFTSQNDLLILGGSSAPHNAADDATIDFGGGADIFNVTGTWLMNGMIVSNLETFNTSGTIYFGNAVPQNSSNASNERPEDVLYMPGTTFNASGASRLVMDVVLDGTAQVGCETLTGAADCLDLRGGTTTGSTVITINNASGDAALTGYDPIGITLVDVSGSGSSAAGHFTLDPASTEGYVHPVFGSAIDAGTFVYLLRYDAANKRHVLISQPKTRDLFDYAILSSAVQSIWHMTTGAVTSRQTDLRDGAGGGSVWLRTTGEVTRRDVTTTFKGWDATAAYDNGYKLYAGTIMGGMDLISGSSGGFDYVVGAQAGYVSSSFDMDASESSGRFSGATGGAYASVWSDWFFLDTALNLNGLALDYQHKALGSKTTTYANAVGASAEAGTRTMLTENAFAEPMLAASWVRTNFEEISIAEGEVQPADADSLRTGLGLRLGATLPGESISASYYVTGRGWYEFEGENGAVVHNPGVDLPFSDEFTGAFGEAELGVNLFNASNTFSSFATGGVKWKDGYSAVNLALGVRIAW